MKKVLIAAALVAVSCWTSPARAGGIEFFGAWNGHAMGAMNDSLESLNAGIGSSFRAIHGGPGVGAALRLWPQPNLLIRLGAERLTARSRDDAARFDLDAWALSLGFTHFFPGGGGFRRGLGVGVEHYRPAGRVGGLEVSGVGFGVRGTAEATRPLGHGWVVGATIGYRFGGVSDLEFGAVSTPMRADYSGLIARLSFAAEGTAATP